MERRGDEPSLIDGMTADLGGPRTAGFLEEVDRAIDFEALADAIREDLAPAQPKGGRPFWPMTLMLKCLLLGKWYGLSDPQLAGQLRDRLSFRRFVRLGLSEATPEETTFVKFRKRLHEAGHLGTLFEGVPDQLRGRGLVLEEGSPVDATIVEQSREGRDAEGDSTRDRCPGDKTHVNVSKDRIVTDDVLDTAKVHDSQHIDGLIRGEPPGGGVYADSAYMDEQRSAELAERGVHEGIVRRRVRGQAELTETQQRHNRACSKVRALVEHPFAWMSAMGYRRARCRGPRRNALDFGLNAIAYNMKRSLSLLGMALPPPKPAA